MFAILRLLKAGYVLTRHGVLYQLLNNLPNIPKLIILITKILAFNKINNTQNIVKAIDKLGPSYIKLAQFLATRPDIVGKELSQNLALLQDKVAPFAKKQALKQIAQSLNLTTQEIEEKLIDFSEPIAAASMAQVHQAYLLQKDGTKIKVAVKVMRPNIKQRLNKDLKSFYLFAKIQELCSAKARRLRVMQIVKELEHNTKIEMDMRLEAAAISEMADNIKNDRNFYVPKIYWNFTGQDVLTMEWIDGIKINDKEQLINQNYNLKLIAENLMQAFLRHALCYGFFHADMHPGNLFITKNQQIAAIDFGITGRLGKRERYFLAQILYGFINRDYMLVSKAHFDAGYVPKHHNIAEFARANRAIGEPIHGQDAKNISMAKLLALLFEVTEIFDMQTRPELILLQKTMVIVEGLARELDPEFNMWNSAKPIVKQWMEENMGIKAIANNIQQCNKSAFELLQDMPEILENFRQTILQRDEIIETKIANGKSHLVKIILGVIIISAIIIKFLK